MPINILPYPFKTSYIKKRLKVEGMGDARLAKKMSRSSKLCVKYLLLLTELEKKVNESLEYLIQTRALNPVLAQFIKLRYVIPASHKLGDKFNDTELEYVSFKLNSLIHLISLSRTSILTKVMIKQSSTTSNQES